jgi:hypothetical protein
MDGLENFIHFLQNVIEYERDYINFLIYDKYDVLIKKKCQNYKVIE